MAAAMMLYAVMEAEEKYERKQIERFNNRERNITKSVLASKSNQVGYGLMAYDTWYVQGQLLSNYHILYTSHNIDDMVIYIKELMINLIRKGLKKKLLFYSVNTDPKIVSYHFIISRTNWTKIIINKGRELCQFDGDKELYKKLYDALDFLKDYDSYKSNLKLLCKKDLKELYYDAYNKKICLLTKDRIIVKLLKYRKKAFCI